MSEKRKYIYNADANAPVVVANIADFQDENHHIYRQEQFVFRTIFMRRGKLYRRSFSLLKDAIDYRDACLRISPTPQRRERSLGGNTKAWHSMFNVAPSFMRTYRVILTTTSGKIRKSFSELERAREWRDAEIRRRGVVETFKGSPDAVQSYSDIGDKSCVFADSDNIRDELDNIQFEQWEEFEQ